MKKKKPRFPVMPSKNGDCRSIIEDVLVPRPDIFAVRQFYHILIRHCKLIQDGGRLEFHEIHRFPNRILDISGKYYWDIYALYASVVEGLRKCAAEGYPASGTET